MSNPNSFNCSEPQSLSYITSIFQFVILFLIIMSLLNSSRLIRSSASASSAIRRTILRKNSFTKSTIKPSAKSYSTLQSNVSRFSQSRGLLKSSLFAASVSSALVFAVHYSSIHSSSVSCQSIDSNLLSSEEAASNPLLKGGLPIYQQLNSVNIEKGIKHIISKLSNDLTELETKTKSSNFKPNWFNLLAPLSSLSDSLSYHAGIISHLERVRDEENLRDAVKRIEPLKVEFGLRIAQSKPIYDAMLKLQDDNQTWSNLDKVQQKIIESYLLDAKLAGVGLEGDDRKQFNEVKQELELLSNKFRNNVLDSTKAFKLIIKENDVKKELDGVPESVLAQFKQAAENDEEIKKTKKEGENLYLIGLGAPDFIPILQKATNRELREKLYRAYTTRASNGTNDNTQVFAKLLVLRHQLAGLLHYSNYGELSLATKLVSNVGQVDSFLEELRVASYEGAVKDLKDLREFAKSKGCSYDLMHWDISFWSEKLREDRYAYSEEMLKQYFQYPVVLQGVFDLLHRLYNVTIKASIEKLEYWHSDVKYYQVFDNSKNDELIAGFYIDPFSRPATKSGGAWMDVLLQRSIVKDESNKVIHKQIPIGYLICNGASPVGDKPALMSFDEVNTLLHELGHVSQHILTRVDHSMASGINNVAWDAVELPSQYNENWLLDKKFLNSISKHVDTGKPIPDELYNKIKAAKVFRFASDQLRQLHFASTDMGLHTKLLYHDSKQVLTGNVNLQAIGESAFSYEQAVAKKTSVLAPLPENRFLNSFTHIFAGGYSAGYYSYKWAEVMSADAWDAIESEVEAGNEDGIKKISTKFRETILALGGGTDAAEVYRMFRGRDPTVDALLKQNGLLKV